MNVTVTDLSSVKVNPEDLLQRFLSSGLSMVEAHTRMHMTLISWALAHPRSSGKTSLMNTTTSTKESENGTTG